MNIRQHAAVVDHGQCQLQTVIKKRVGKVRQQDGKLHYVV